MRASGARGEDSDLFPWTCIGSEILKARSYSSLPLCLSSAHRLSRLTLLSVRPLRKLISMATDTKDNIYELQRPVNGEHSPASEEGHLDAVHSSTRQDDADMHRLGRRQELNVSHQRPMNT